MTMANVARLQDLATAAAQSNAAIVQRLKSISAFSERMKQFEDDFATRIISAVEDRRTEAKEQLDKLQLEIASLIHLIEGGDTPGRPKPRLISQ